MSVSVCLSVACMLPVSRARSCSGGVAILVRRTAGNASNVVFFYAGFMAADALPQQHRSNVVHWLTPPLRGTDCVLPYTTTASAKT